MNGLYKVALKREELHGKVRVYLKRRQQLGVFERAHALHVGVIKR